tara:strand:- start:1890 stop:3845 length:1956 start_codon:yes stop_codon:yes gene_type:complete
MNTTENIEKILELFKSNKLIEAKKEIEKKIKIYPNSFVLYNILGAVLAAQNKLDDAIQNYKKSLKINSNYAQAYNNLGTALHKINKIDESIDCYKKAIDIKIDFAEAYNNLGNAFVELKKSENAIEYFYKAIRIKPNFAEAFHSLGTANERLGNKQESLKNYQEALKIKPDYAEVFDSMGTVLSDLARYDESIKSFNKAIELNSNYEQAYNNLGNALSHLGKYDEATKAYQKAIKIKPNYPKAYSNLLFNLNYKTDFDSDLYLSIAKKFRLDCMPEKKNLILQKKYQKNPKELKLGFVSADFGNHPGGFFTLSTLRELKNKNFELIAYATTDRKDEFSHHFKTLFSKWNLVEKKKDEEIVKQIIEDGIHILFDLQGHSANNKLTVFMYKPAPLQLTWLGQGSTGISEIDYFIGSPHITPAREEKNYVEKILRLPEISQCFTPPDFEVKINELPANKNNFITFGCVNKLTKINNEVIKLWSKILLLVSNSKLILKNKDFDNSEIYNNTLSRFKKNSIDKDRLILLGESKSRKELLSIYNKIDIALDPFPFQGNTSTCESVWMGVPVLTLKGDRYLFHFGESINSNLGMDHWIAKTKEEYISKAVNYSKDLNELSKIRMNLRKIALKSPVFDSKRLVEHFNKMLWEIWNNSSK